MTHRSFRMRTILAACCLTALLTSPALANKVYVSNEKGNTVTVLDSETWEVLTEFPAGNRPRGITISPDGKLLYVCASDDDTVRVFDAESYEELYTLPSGPDPELFILHPSGNPLYIANEDDNIVTVVDTVKAFGSGRDPRRCRTRGHGRSAPMRDRW